jgi:hypothetical protein
MKKHTLLYGAALLAALALNPLPVHADPAADFAALPAPVQATAKTQLGSDKVDEVEPTTEKGTHATEVEYKDNGQKMAIVIADDGTLIQKEHRMSPTDAPDVIKTAVTTQLPGATITHIKEVQAGTLDYFDLSAKDTDGKSHHLKFDPTGKLLTKTKGPKTAKGSKSPKASPDESPAASPADSAAASPSPSA